MSELKWPQIENEALVEKLLPAIQQAIVDVCAAEQSVGPTDMIPMPGADVSNVLLMVLATIIEPMPECATPRGARLIAEAAGKELALLIRDTRQLKLADKRPHKTPQ